MAQKALTESEIAGLLLDSDSDNDGLDSISVDDSDGDDDGPEETEEVLKPRPLTPPILTPPPLTPPPLSPGSQDLFDELPSPSRQPVAKRQRPSSSAATAPPAKRQRRQQCNSGECFVSHSQILRNRASQFQRLFFLSGQAAFGRIFKSRYKYFSFTFWSEI